VYQRERQRFATEAAIGRLLFDQVNNFGQTDRRKSDLFALLARKGAWVPRCLQITAHAPGSTPWVRFRIVGIVEPEDPLISEITATAGEPTIGQLAEAHPEVVLEFRKLDMIGTATTFAGLLTTPRLQANCIRIEALVHLAAAYCVGRGAPTRGLVRRSFERLGAGYCGMMEDPAEDVFATLVNTPRGNFRIFEGVREAAGFYLQRILNVVEGI
jgi:hypothetical protein